MIVPFNHVLVLSGLLFFLGLFGVVVRRNLVMILLGTLVVAATLIQVGRPFLVSIRQALFQIVAIHTTTGFGTDNFTYHIVSCAVANFNLALIFFDTD